MNVILAVLVSAFAHGEEPFGKLDKVLTLANDRGTSNNELHFVISPADAVEGLSYLTIGGGKTEEKSFPVTDLSTPVGAVLEEHSGIKALTLKGKLGPGTGQLEFTYIANGLTGEYKSCKVNAVKSAAGDWGFINAYTNKPVSDAKIVTWNMGISTIEGICP